jgi:hypothetical protein
MPTLPRLGSMIAGRAGQRRVRLSKWSIELHEHRFFSRHPVLDHHGRDTLCRLLPEAIHDRQRYRLTCGFPRGLKLG